MSVIYIRNKETGEFETMPVIKGDSYVLTNEDKQEIAEKVVPLVTGLLNANGVSF